jgi:hypothetical protein
LEREKDGWGWERGERIHDDSSNKHFAIKISSILSSSQTSIKKKERDTNPASCNREKKRLRK